MGTKKTEDRYMEIDVPEQVMAEVAEIIGENEMEATILGIGDKPESITIGFDYSPDDRDDMMKILELVEDYYTDEGEEEESEED
jgi:hypothetical protein